MVGGTRSGALLFFFVFIIFFFCSISIPFPELGARWFLRVLVYSHTMVDFALGFLIAWVLCSLQWDPPLFQCSSVLSHSGNIVEASQP